MYGVNVLDPALEIKFPFDVSSAIISEADQQRPSLKDVDSPFDY